MFINKSNVVLLLQNLKNIDIAFIFLINDSIFFAKQFFPLKQFQFAPFL